VVFRRIVYATGNRGFCTACGAEAHGVEPDAHDYECEICGEWAVYGAEELIVTGEYEPEKGKSEKS